jgi:hypothetical protein
MDANKYDRSVELECPTCGGTSFSTDDNQPEIKTCARCNREFAKDELIRANQSKIQANVNEIKKQVTADITKQLKDAFRKFK